MFRYCDLLYQGFTPEQKALWKAGIKKPGISAYDLWMSECLSLSLMKQRPPDVPSSSGGWSTRNIAPGSLFDAAPCWDVMVRPPPVILCQGRWVGFPHPTTWEFTCTWAENVLDYPLIERMIAFYLWVPAEDYWKWHCTLAHPITEVYVHFEIPDEPRNVTCSWPIDVARQISMPSSQTAPWDIWDPNALPWTPPPQPRPIWPNPLEE